MAESAPARTPGPPGPSDAVLTAWAFFAPRVWALLHAEIQAGIEAKLPHDAGLLALAGAFIEVGRELLDMRDAFTAAGGDAEIAALLLGIERKLAGVPPSSPPPAPAPSAPRRRSARRASGH